MKRHLEMSRSTDKTKYLAFIMFLDCVTSIAYSQPQTEYGSYITTTTYLNATQSRSLQQRVYDNGLGDVLQEVQIGITSDGKDLTVHHDYDQYRRETKVWLPYASASGGSYINRTSIMSNDRSYYSDNCPYSETVYETFTGKRPSYQYKPGQLRHDNQKRGSMSYYTETGRHFVLVSSGFLGITNNKTFACTQVTDEDGHISVQKYNGVGRTMMKRQADGNTAYVYDYKGNLSHVLPPLLYDYAQTVNSTVLGDENEKMQQYAYIYRYDDRNNCIYKKLPGCEPVYYIYDKAGNCIFTQNGEQRASGCWIYTIPDKFGRPCITGTCRNSLNYASDPLHTVVVRAEYTGATNDQQGYSISGGISLTSPVLRSAVFYDNYTFIGRNGCPTAMTYSSEGIGQWDQSVHYGHPTGSVTSYEKTDGSVDYNYTATYYDEYHQPLQERSTNHIGGINILTNTYTYTGEPEQQYIRVTKGSGTSSTVLRAEYQNIYSAQPHNNQLLHRVLKLKNASGAVIHMDTIQSLTYNDLGQIAELKRGGHQADMSYEYDPLQGVLRGISSNCGFVQTLHREDDAQHPLYNGSVSSMEWHYPGETELHKYAYDYDSYNRLTDAVYSQTVYSASASRSRGADSMMEELPVNRLVPAPELQSTANTSRYGTSYSYDKHGNILSLERRGMMNSRSYGVIDDLTVTYNGNRRVSVSDAAGSLTYAGASDFVDGASASAEYTYDNNGSLTKDQNRGITDIQYDLLGNPKKITFSGNRTIEYLYSSEGKRMRAIHSYPQNPNVTSSALHRDTTDYVCGLILKNRHPESYQFDGGYATFTNDSYSGWHYYVQDYLGSNRLVVNRNGTVEQKTHYYPYGGMMGDISTNESTQKYKFEGKELDRSFGLDDYDIHARNYYAMLPMWDRVDPLAEKYYGISPYVYCGGDPVNNKDYDGRDTYNVDSLGFISVVRDNNKNSLNGANQDGITQIIVLNTKQTEMIEGLIASQKNEGSDVGIENFGKSKGIKQKDAKMLFKALADNSAVEWQLTAYNSFDYKIATIHKNNFSPTIKNLKKLRWTIHSHPDRDGSLGPSGETYPSSLISGDYNVAFSRYNIIKPSNISEFPAHFVYHRFSQSVYKYDPWSSKRINSWFKY